jgi:ferritin-like metal-binding protein YciE
MPVKTVQDLLLNELRDLYDAEKQLVKALPKMAKAASSEQLRQAIQVHLEETKVQVERLEGVFERFDTPQPRPSGDAGIPSARPLDCPSDLVGTATAYSAFRL